MRKGVIDMGYWKWWFGKEKWTKFFFIYWVACITLGFLRMAVSILSYSFPPDLFDFIIINIAIVIHPGVAILSAMCVDETVQSYKKYKRENQQVEK